MAEPEPGMAAKPESAAMGEPHASMPDGDHKPRSRVHPRWQPIARVLLVLAGLLALNRFAYGLWRAGSSGQAVDALTWAMPVIALALWWLYRWCFKPVRG